MPQSGRRPQHHSRRFDRTVGTSGLPRSADIRRVTRHINVPFPANKISSPSKTMGFAKRSTAYGVLPRQVDPTGKSVVATKTCPALPKKYFAFAVGQISSTSSPRPFPARGALRGRHERGMGCGGRDSVGAQVDRRADLPVSGSRRAGRTALVAYGKTVWLRHPLLVPSCRWRIRSNRIDQPSSRQRR